MQNNKASDISGQPISSWQDPDVQFYLAIIFALVFGYVFLMTG